MIAIAPPPLVSVIVPCYNQGRFLSDAIESALRQTHAPAEVIVVDDGSIDETAAVVARYPSVRYMRQQNNGAPSARNAGLRASGGEFVVFLDADDRLVPDALARGIEWLHEQPDCAFVTGHVTLIAHDGSPVATPAQSHADGDQFVALLRSNYIWTPGAVLYRRKVLEDVGGFDPAADASADFELNIRIARRFPIGCHHHVVLEYRQHGANMSTDLGTMLRSALGVRMALRDRVLGDPRARAAWQEGIEIVKADFGRRLMRQVRADLRAGRRVRALKGLACLLRYYPAGLLEMVAGRASSRSSLSTTRHL
ncbi:MAG TPA: glycosyltransferase [Vicinamibacterales bacterium]|nr:glycosyltransferase [Vicinamibacterales bacterium]